MIALSVNAQSSAVVKTNFGSFSIVLFDEKAPNTVKQFKASIKSHFYDNTIFHRLVSDFMIQGGGYDVFYQQKATRPLLKSEANNGLKNKKWTLSMARHMEKDSASNQFFINLADNSHLDYRNDSNFGAGYTVFGMVISGHSVIQNMSLIETTSIGEFQADVPEKLLIIESITIEKESL